MTSSSPPGNRGERVPGGSDVTRLAKESSSAYEAGAVHPSTFDLSSEDKAAPLQSLSVWVSELTTCGQARELIDESKRSLYVYCLSLSIDRIRQITIADSGTNLDVVWDPLHCESSGVRLPDERPGAGGHAGVINYKRPPGMDKALYKELRSKLADVVERIERL